jgi:hypothetical protein
MCDRNSCTNRLPKLFHQSTFNKISFKRKYGELNCLNKSSRWILFGLFKIAEYFIKTHRALFSMTQKLWKDFAFCIARCETSKHIYTVTWTNTWYPLKANENVYTVSQTSFIRDSLFVFVVKLYKTMCVVFKRKSILQCLIVVATNS